MRYALLFLTLAAVACKSAEPNPSQEEIAEQAKPENAERPEEFKSADEADTGEVDDGWLASFRDPELEKVVEESLRNNPNLRIAASQVESAAAAAVQAGARLKPTLDLALGGTGSGTSAYSGTDGVVGLSSTWEIDVWGKLSAGVAAAGAELAATQTDFAFARQSLAAQTSKAWFLATQTHMLLELSREVVELQTKTLELVQEKLKVGQVTKQDEHLAKASLASAEEALREAMGADKQARRGLELLLGRYPSAEIQARTKLPALPPPVPVGLTAELLERRPDLRSAESRVAAAFQLTKQAEAARLPSVALTADVGAASGVNDMIFSLGAGVVAPLFRGGALEAQVDEANAAQKAAIAAYAQAVLKAFEEVEAALTDGKLLDEREGFLETRLDESTKAWRLAQQQYEVGKIDLLSVLIQQADVIAARIAMISIRSTRLMNRIKLHLALGGSFEEADAN